MKFEHCELLVVCHMFVGKYCPMLVEFAPSKLDQVTKLLLKPRLQITRDHPSKAFVGFLADRIIHAKSAAELVLMLTSLIHLKRDHKLTEFGEERFPPCPSWTQAAENIRRMPLAKQFHDEML